MGSQIDPPCCYLPTPVLEHHKVDYSKADFLSRLEISTPKSGDSHKGALFLGCFLLKIYGFENVFFKKLQIWFKDTVLFSKEVFKNVMGLSPRVIVLYSQKSVLYFTLMIRIARKAEWKVRVKATYHCNYIHCPRIEGDPSFVTFWLSDSMRKL